MSRDCRTYWEAREEREPGAIERRNATERAKHLKRKYGITVEDRDAMLAVQESCCAICKRPEPGGRNNQWHVDHDHDTGKVRALLCSNCNMALGLIHDDWRWAQALATYLRGTH